MTFLPFRQTGFDAQSYVAQTLARHGLSVGPTAGGGASLPAPLKVRRAKPASKGRSRQTFTCGSGSRDYVLRLPQGDARGLILMLHGCTQTPEDFAVGTRMGEIAAEQGLITVWPAQERGANAQSCWNWFSAADQGRDRGEPAILAALVQDVADRHAVAPGRSFVAGLSAGAAMAVILGRTHGDVFSAVGAHSGLPHGCAKSVTEAFSAMAGAASRSAVRSAPVPTIVFHGDADATVRPVNSDRIMADAAGKAGGPALIDSGTTGGRSWQRATTMGDAGKVLTEDWRVAGLGHLWSGGDGKGSYTDAAGPDASREMLRFFLARTDG